MDNLTEIIEKCKRIIITPITENIVESLYIGGSIQAKDRIETSDIDIIGIVKDNFPEEFENKINAELKNKIKEMTCKLRIIYDSELKGGEQKGFITKLLPVKLFIRRLPHFPIIWGKEIDTNNTIGPYSYNEEAKVQIKIIKNYIKQINAKTKPVPFEWIPKAVFYLSAIELASECKTKYLTSLSEIESQLKEEKNHIVHESMKIRLKNYEITEREKVDYLNKVLEYLEEIKTNNNGISE